MNHLFIASVDCVDILQCPEHFLCVAEAFFLPFHHRSGDDEQKATAEFEFIARDGPNILQRMAGLLPGDCIV